MSILAKIKEKHNSPWLFFAVTFGLTWLFWIPAALLDMNIRSIPVVLLIFLGGLFGKVMPAVILPYLTYGRAGLTDYWKRLIDFKRVSLGWWLVTFSFPVIFTALGILTGIITGGSPPKFAMTDPLDILVYGLFILLYGPLPEELGWTGYELDRLQARYNALASSIILGIFWGIWHLPLFFIEGSYQHSEVVLGSLRFWLSFYPGIISLQILQTWIYNNNNRSTLTAVMIHFMVNFMGELLIIPEIQEYYITLWSLIITAIIVIIWKPKSLTGNAKGPDFKHILEYGRG